MCPRTDEQERLTRSNCPVANALELFGDRWTLLIIRDLLLGKNHYKEFAASPERISTNILADRLRNLQKAEIVVKESAPGRGGRVYRLTPKGEELRPVLKALSAWAEKYVPGVERFPLYERPR